MKNSLDALLGRAAADKIAPGFVAVVADGRSLLYEGAFGLRDESAADAVQTNTIFRIASMTKLATAIAVLQQVERGLTTLDTPVGDVLPEFDGLKVLDGFDGDIPRLRPARSRATIRQLLSHISGLAYDIWNADLARYEAITKHPRLGSGLREALTSEPLVNDPGTKFNYGTSMDWAGLVVEALTGKRLEIYWQDELFGPLGMADTVVHLDPARRARTAPVHARDAQGKWQPTPINFAVDPEFYPGGHGLHSTAADFLKLQQMLLNEGKSPAGQILKPATIDEMLSNQIGSLNVGTIVSARPLESLDAPLNGNKWGLGLMLDPADIPGGRKAGSAGWMGGFNTFFWVDRKSGLTAALYTQTIPFYDDAIMNLYRRFETTAYASV